MVDDNKTITEYEQAIVRNLARDCAYKWRSVDAEDIESDLYVHFFENYKHMLKYREFESESKRRNYLVKALYRRAVVYCAKENSYRSGNPQTAGWTKEQMTAAVPFIWEDIGIGGVVEFSTFNLRNEIGKDNMLNYRNYTQTEDLLLLVFGVREAYDKLTEQQQYILKRRYDEGMTNEEIGSTLGLNKYVVSRYINRALDSLYVKLGSL